MADPKAKVLVVDDDARMQLLMTEILAAEGYQVYQASDGESALDLHRQRRPDLILLDITMPGMDGFTVCREIRQSSQVPIVMVTGLGDEAEKVAGLDASADDYVTKPFSARELVARVRAVLRRGERGSSEPQPPFQSGELTVDFDNYRVLLAGAELPLTATEFRLLSHFATNAGRTLTADQVLDAVWGAGYRGEHHLLQVTIGRLRQKLQDDADKPTFIATRKGIGYEFLKEG